MVRPKRQVLATYAESSAPPDELPESHIIARVIKGEGNNLFRVQEAKGKKLLVELPSQFRSTFFLRRGGFVVVNLAAFAERDNKLDGEIVNLVREEKAWRKQSYWPAEFAKKQYEDSEDESEEESNVGKMPPSDSEEED